MTMRGTDKGTPAEQAIAPPSFVVPPPLGLYAHLPWCARKCPYCDFNSHKAPEAIPERQYADALLADAETLPPLVWGRRVNSLFIGGGTPSLFSPETMDRILSGLRALSLLAPDAEITLEANPDSSDTAKFAEFSAAGINRLSLGAQSFDDRALLALGRIHDGKRAHRAAAAAAECFDNFNIDLMHALPGQTAAMARADLAAALSYAPPHLSLYQLTLESGTPFFRRPPPGLPDEDESANIADAVAEDAAAAGYERYEISAFAKPGKRCAHNLNYWRFGDYVAVGAGAHSKITVGGKIHRHARIKHPGDYMRRAAAGDAIAEKRTVAGREAAFEFMLNALRLPEGFPPTMLSERAGVSVASLETILADAEKDGLIVRDKAVIRPSPKGLRYLNELLIRFLPDKDFTPPMSANPDSVALRLRESKIEFSSARE